MLFYLRNIISYFKITDTKFATSYRKTFIIFLVDN